MASIRWLNSSVAVLAFFNNLILISCFFGLGVGCLLARRTVQLIDFIGPVFLLLVAAVVFLKLHGVEISYREDIIFAPTRIDESDRWIWVSFSALAGFALTVVFFVLLGQELGRQLEAFDEPLTAYALDIGGSVAGVLAYAALAWLGTTPAVWYGTGFLALMPLLAQQARRMAMTVATVPVALVLIGSSDPAAEWSPYYKVEHKPYQAEENRHFGYVITVDNVRIQDALAFVPALARSPLWAWAPYYELPYHFIRPNRVLILGAGAGNEAVMAHLMGAQKIQAVEIDPVIASYGFTLHPHRPYARSDVTITIDDARSYVSNTKERYDLILMSALDSHKQIAGAASLRLESFVYTVESYARIRELLTTDGIFCLSLSSGRGWMGPRTYWSLTKAFGHEPRVYTSSGSPFESVSYLYGPDAAFERDLLPSSWPIRRVPGPPAGAVTLATDDWPHMYLKDPVIPAFYVFVIVILLIASTSIVVGTEPDVRRPDLHLFLLGAGFMLLETRSITQMALLFGATWMVNAVVVASILLTILLANRLVQGGASPRRSVTYALLIATLGAGYLFPLQLLLGLPVAARLAVASVVVGVPIFWASILFSSAFRDATRVGHAFGSNLLGVVFGGCLEYVSNIYGLNALYLLALALYVASAIVLRRGGGISAQPTGA